MQKEDILNYLKTNKEKFYRQYGIEFIGLFGSFARDEANEQSDIDIVYTIDEKQKLSIFKYLEILQRLENFFNKKVDLVRYEKLKPRLKSYIQKDLTYV